MSLYNNVQQSLGSSGGSNWLTQGVMGNVNSLLGQAGSAVSNALGGGVLVNAVTKGVQNAASHAVEKTINKYIPKQIQKAVNVGMSATSDLLNGNWQEAGMKVLRSGLIGDLFPKSSGIISQYAAYGVPTPMYGGVSPAEAKRIYEESRGETFAKKNLWLIEVSSPLNCAVSGRFNLFATELEYSPFIVQGDKVKVGGATVDSVTSNDPVELTVTTLDDSAGSIKLWFAAHHAAAVARDGTVGEPGKYAIRVKIVHHFISDTGEGYQDIGLFRPESLQVSLSRRDDNLEELQMTFSQLDTFMEP